MIDNQTLAYIPMAEMDRIRNLKAPADTVTSLFADACRINTLYMISFAGSGHVGSSLSSLDIVSNLYLQRMQGVGEEKGDVYFSSKGHDVPGLYSVLIGLGLLPFDKMHQLRKLGGLPGHPDIGTAHIVTNTGSLGMGISKARGMIQADRLNGVKRNYYVLLGDGELQEGHFWESLLPVANQDVSEIVAIVDHNKLQSDMFISKVSDLGDLEARVRAHGWEVARCDGHDQAALGDSLERLCAQTSKPSLLLADTVKAKGGGSMESTYFTKTDRLYKFHSGAPSPDRYVSAVEGLIEKINSTLKDLGEPEIGLENVGRPVDRPPLRQPQKLIDAYSKALVKAGESNEKVVVLDGDLALDCGLIRFEEKFPERFFECGIAEQDMVSVAGGMALKGLLPVVHSFACFLSTRPNEQIFNNATEKTKIIYVGSLAGILPGGPGHSHQSVRDISVLAGVPGLVLIEPCCENEVEMAVDYCLSISMQSCYLRLVSIPSDTSYKLPDHYRLKLGRGISITEGKDAVLFGYGPILLEEAYKAAETLKEKHGIGLKVVNMPWLNVVNDEWLKATVKGYNRIFTLDNHFVSGGQGEMLLSRLAELGVGSDYLAKKIGVERIPECGTNSEVLKAHGLDAASLSEIIRLHISQA